MSAQASSETTTPLQHQQNEQAEEPHVAQQARSLHDVPLVQGMRLVVRCRDEHDPFTGRMTFKDFVGHVLRWNSECLDLQRDAAANGSRPEQQVHIPVSCIVSMKPIPERRRPQQ